MRRLLLPCLLIAITAACPVPLRHTRPTTSAIVGVLVDDDGAPVTEARVAASTPRWGRATCGDSMLETTTDAAGRFALPGTSRQHRVVWIFPGDIKRPRYTLCSRVGGDMRLAFEGWPKKERDGVDTLSCLRWAWRDTTRVTCNERRRVPPAIVVGGSWRQDTTAGSYRVIEADEGFDPGVRRDPPARRPLIVVQWLAADGARARVVAAEALAIPDKFILARFPTLVRAGDAWQVEVWAYWRGSGSVERLAFPLGPPGILGRAVPLPLPRDGRQPDDGAPWVAPAGIALRQHPALSATSPFRALE